MERPSRYGAPDPEQLDTTPVEMPLGYMRPTPLQELIASMVREQVQAEKAEDFETEAEADDFTEDDPALLDMSAYTLDVVQEETPLESPPAEPDQEELAPEPDKPSETGDPPDPNAEETG